MKNFLFLALGLWMTSSFAWAFDYGDNDDDSAPAAPTHTLPVLNPVSTPTFSPTPFIATPTPVPPKVKNWQDAGDIWPNDEDGPPIVKRLAAPSVTATPFEDASFATMAGVMPYNEPTGPSAKSTAAVMNRPALTPVLKPVVPGHFILQFQGGLGIPTSNQFASLLVPGFSGEALAGYALDGFYTLGIEFGVESLPYSGGPFVTGTGASVSSVPSFSHVPVLLVCQYNVSTDGPVKPFALIGAGPAFDTLGGTLITFYHGVYTSNTSLSQSYTNFELELGAGLALAVTDKINIFLQGKIEAEYGFNTNGTVESIDNAIYLIPIQAGVNFPLN